MMKKFFPYSQIDVVQFPAGLGGNDIIEHTFKGPIHQQLCDALQYIQNSIITEKYFALYEDKRIASIPFSFSRIATLEGTKSALYHYSRIRFD